MCGIYAHLYNSESVLGKTYHNAIKNRGPDNTTCLSVGKGVDFCFHRLKINDLSDDGNQPIIYNGIYLICNGEIYNSNELRKEFVFDWKSNSDCEVLINVYMRYGFEEMCNKIDGVFAIILYDSNQNLIHIGRDPFGVRPMFFGDNDSNDIEIASEVKCINNSLNANQFPPGHFLTINSLNIKGKEPKRYFHINYENITNYNYALDEIKDKFEKAVLKRLMSDRPIGCLLSGGLDSSLVSSIVAREFKRHNKGILNTFSIGFEGSTDLMYAKKVAEHIGSIHHEVLLTANDFINAIPEVIKTIESYDTTTVRASVGNYLISKYIKENTNITVVFNGDGSDEVAGGYLYMKNAPSDIQFHNECLNLINNIHFFDVLRSDRSLSSNWSLESRTPFLDKTFVQTYLSTPISFRLHNSYGIEKSLLRNAFKNDNLLPHDVLYRTKEAFSDGVSGSQNSWHKIIQNHVNTIINDEEFYKNIEFINHNKPDLKESYYYRKIFHEYYPTRHNIIPHFWLPKWTNTKDPSARELK